jgi:NAD(P)-dependent dehydrogenase (short-subunit alcohol dehydrogenase family)
VPAGLLDGRVALITGGASGHGRAAAALFGYQGARVVVADLDDDAAGQTIERVHASGSTGMAVHADVTQRADCDAMVNATINDFGRLDILYNNAPVQMSGRLVDTSEDDWDLVMATNLDAVFWTCRAALPHLVESGNASIISTASVLGLTGAEGSAAYGAANAGLVALMRQIATEYGPAVRANVIAPGSIDTPRFRTVAETMPAAFVPNLEATIPLHRLGTAEDVAGIALFLASDLAAYTTGAVIPADGGLAALR